MYKTAVWYRTEVGVEKLELRPNRQRRITNDDHGVLKFELIMKDCFIISNNQRRRLVFKLVAKNLRALMA